MDTPVATTPEIPAENGESDEKKYGMDDTSSEVLYQRFKDLIDRGNFAFKAGDIVKGRVERYAEQLRRIKRSNPRGLRLLMLQYSA